MHTNEGGHERNGGAISTIPTDAAILRIHISKQRFREVFRASEAIGALLEKVNHIQIEGSEQNHGLN